MIKVTEADKAYLAGLLDGEGCLHISKQNRPRLTSELVHAGVVIISQGEKQADVLTEYRSKLGGIGSIQPSSDRNGNACYHWRMCAKAAEKFIKLVFPYLVIKIKQAEIFLRYRKTFEKQGGWGPYRTSLVKQAEREKYRIQLMEAKRGIAPPAPVKRQKRPIQLGFF